MLRGAKHLNACRTKAQRHHQSHTCAPFDSPARGGSPLLIPPHAGERKGAVMLRGAKHLNACPTKTLRSRQTLASATPALQPGASLDSSLALRMTRVGRGNGDPRALIFGHAKHTCLESWMHSKWPCSTVFGMASAHHSSNCRRRAMPMPCVVLRPMPA